MKRKRKKVTAQKRKLISKEEKVFREKVGQKLAEENQAYLRRYV
jgi:hypothetical protein